jgi:hypothetical protein
MKKGSPFYGTALTRALRALKGAQGMFSKSILRMTRRKSKAILGVMR